MASIFVKALRDRRRVLIWWALGMIATALMLASFYPTIRETGEDLNAYIENLPEALRAIVLSGGGDFTSGPGYLNSELFSFMLPLIVLVFSVGMGAGVVAGEEREGRLELMVASPVTRRRIVLQKLAAILVGMIGLGIVLWATLAVGVEIWDIPVDHANLVAACAMAVFLGWVFGALALAVGAATGRRGMAIGIPAAVGVATYLVNGLAPLSDALEFWRPLSPFYYYAADQPIRSGIDLGDAGILLALSVILGIAAVLAFDRRDLAT
ncbi:MAG TPA: ABC transporter permease subunit [Actinomycetota bacterium]